MKNGNGDATPTQDGSVDSAAKAIEGLLSEDGGTETPKPEKRTTRERGDSEPSSKGKRQGRAADDDSREDEDESDEDEDEDRDDSDSDDEDEDDDSDEADEDGDSDEDEDDDSDDEDEDDEDDDSDEDEEESDDDEKRLKKLRSTPHTVTLPGGKKITVKYDELLRGYSREADYSQKTMALADEKKKFVEEELTPVRSERKRYAGMLDELESALKVMTGQGEPDWEKLREELDSEDFSARLLAWNAHKDRLGKIATEKENLRKQQEADAEKEYAEYMKQQHGELLKKLPKWSDAKVAKKDRAAMRKYALSIGLTHEMVDGIADHRIVLALRDAMLYRRIQANKPKVRDKINKAIKSTPSRGERTERSTSSRKAFRASYNKARESGRVEDAAAAIEHLL